MAPGADPNRIGFEISGVSHAQVLSSGALALSIGDRQILHRQPVVYQKIHGERRQVKGWYELREVVSRHRTRSKGYRVSFGLGAYDQQYPLVIDPVLSYSTFLGGSGADAGVAIAVDSQGNMYVAGGTTSSDLPPSVSRPRNFSGVRDAFVAKISADGQSLLYLTYVGGSNIDYATGIALDAAGNAYVCGVTYSADFPTQSAYQSTSVGYRGDAFFTKLNAQGEIVQSSYFGGSGQDAAQAIALDGDGNICLTGHTYSDDFPTVNPLQATWASKTANRDIPDAFVAKFSATGLALVYSTYLEPIQIGW